MQEIIIDATNRKQYEHLLQQYFHLRSTDYRNGLYKDGCDKYDEKDNTIFILCISDELDEVIGGARFIFKDHETRLKFEESYNVRIKDFIGHIPNLKELKIAELSGVVVSEKYRGRHIGSHIQEIALRHVLDDKVDVDIVAAMLTKANTNCFIRVLKGFLGNDLQSAIINRHNFFRGDERRVLTISANAQKGIQLLTSEQLIRNEATYILSNTEVQKNQSQNEPNRTFVGITSGRKSFLWQCLSKLDPKDEDRCKVAI